MAWIHPEFAEHQRKRFTRSDAYRWQRPDQVDDNAPSYLRKYRRSNPPEHSDEIDDRTEAGYPARRINNPDNIVRIPRMKHWEINAWYQTSKRELGDISPREYLKGKDWDERRRIGLEALRRFGVLAP